MENRRFEIPVAADSKSNPFPLKGRAYNLECSRSRHTASLRFAESLLDERQRLVPMSVAGWWHGSGGVGVGITRVREAVSTQMRRFHRASVGGARRSIRPSDPTEGATKVGLAVPSAGRVRSGFQSGAIGTSRPVLW